MTPETLATIVLIASFILLVAHNVPIAFSIGIKLAFILLVLLGLSTMWMAVVADVGVALLVTLNGLRLLRWNGSPCFDASTAG